MRIETFGSLRARVTGGVDRQGGGDGPVVVLLHGYGAPGDDLAQLHRVIAAPAGTRFVFPEALLALDAQGSGRAWWSIDMMQIQLAMMRGEVRDMSKQEPPEGLREARDAIGALLDDVDAKLKPSKIALGGFSQGAMLSLDVALRGDRAFAGVVLLSGTHIAADEWAPLLAKLKDVPVFMSHGRHDQLLGFAISERLRDLLKNAGVAVDWHPFNGGHEIPHPVVTALGAFLQRTLG